MRRLMTAALLFMNAHPVIACSLSIPEKLLQGRVSGVNLVIEGAAASVARIKPGWTLSVVNDPSWKTSITGRAIVGAAFLPGPEILSMLTFSPAPGLSCETILDEKQSTAITLTFYERDRLMTRQIEKHDVHFVQ